MVRAPPETTLVRGRTEPLDDGRTEAVAPLLEEEEELPEGFALPEGLLLVDGLLPDEGRLPPDEGLAPVDGVLAFGVVGFSAAGGTFACATGASLYDRL